MSKSRTWRFYSDTPTDELKRSRHINQLLIKLQMLANSITHSDWYSIDDEYRSDSIDQLLNRVNELIDIDDFEESLLLLRNNLNGWIRAGVIYHNIKLKKLYKYAAIKAKSFKDFCIRYAKRNTSTVNRLIEAAYVVIHLARAGFDILPHSAAQAGILAKFIKKDDPYGDYDSELIAKWQLVIEQLPEHEFSALKIAEIVDSAQPPKPSLRLAQNTKLKLIKKAAARGLSSDEYLNLLLDEDELEIEEQEDNQEETTEFKSTDGDVKPKPLRRFPSIFSSLYSQPKSSNKYNPRLAQGVVPFSDDGWSNSS